VEATRGELEAPGNAADREKWQSLLAVRAWIGGKFDVAQKEMKKVPGGRLHLAALEEIASLGTYVDWMATDLAIYGTPGWDDYRKGEAAVDLYATRDDAAALQHFERALKLSASDSKAARSLRALIALEKYEVQFATGEWTEIPLSLDTWRVRAGSFSNADDGSLVMHSDREARGFVCFQGVTGHRYDLRGHFTAEPGAGTPALFGVAVRAQRFASGAFLHFSSAPAENGTALITNLRDHFRELEENGRKPATGKTAARDDNEFLVHVTPEAVSFELNGEKVVPEFETKRYARTFFDGRIGLIASHRDPPTFTRVTKLEIRKIGTGE